MARYFGVKYVAIRRTGELLCVITLHLLDRAHAAVKPNRSKDLFTSCQAVSRLGTSATIVVVVLVMALLSFADSSPRAYRLKVGNASLPSSIGGDIPQLFARLVWACYSALRERTPCRLGRPSLLVVTEA
jgi:hypothetical protein